MSLTLAWSGMMSAGLTWWLRNHTCIQAPSPAEHHTTKCVHLDTLYWIYMCYSTNTTYPYTLKQAVVVLHHTMSVRSNVNEWGEVFLTFWYSSSICSTFPPPGSRSRERFVNSSTLVEPLPQLHIKRTNSYTIQSTFQTFHWFRQQNYLVRVRKNIMDCLKILTWQQYC